jgi:hypothetical protein
MKKKIKKTKKVGAIILTIYTPGCGTPPAPTCQDCPTKEQGGVRGIWIQKSSYTFADITNPVEWNTAICAGNVFVFPFTNGSVDESPNESTGYGNTPMTQDSISYTIDFHEPQYKNNVPFWNFMKRSQSFKIGYKTGSLLHLSSVAAQIGVKAPVSADIKTKIDLNVIAKFTQEDLIVPTFAPSTIFDTCVDC